MRVYGVTGWKNAGKTGLVTRLVTEITRRGLTVSTVKNTHHAVDLDVPGTDSFRHREAGAQEVVLTSEARMILMREWRAPDDTRVETLIERLAPVDLVLVEGFKRAPHPKIEAHRAVTGQPLLSAENTTIRAIAADAPVQSALPVFGLDDTGAIADFILHEVGLR